MYEMMAVGGLFGATTGGLMKVRETREIKKMTFEAPNTVPEQKLVQASENIAKGVSTAGIYDPPLKVGSPGKGASADSYAGLNGLPFAPSYFVERFKNPALGVGSGVKSESTGHSGAALAGKSLNGMKPEFETAEKLDKLAHEIVGINKSAVHDLLIGKRKNSYVPGTGADFIDKAPKERAELVRELAESGTHLRHDRLDGLIKLQEIYGAKSDTFQSLKALSGKSPSLDLSNVARFIDEKPGTRKAFVQKITESGAARQLSSSVLGALEAMSDIYGPNSPTNQKTV